MIAEVGDGTFNYFFGGPLNIVLVAVVVLSIGYSAYSELQLKRQQRMAQAKDDSTFDIEEGV
jgi:putative tricarboxylic transport membrane protein